MTTKTAAARNEAALVDEAIDILASAGFRPMDTKEMGLNGWFAHFDAVVFTSASTLLLAAIEEGDERIVLSWMDTKGVELEPSLRLPINAHGRRLVAAIRKA